METLLPNLVEIILNNLTLVKDMDQPKNEQQQNMIFILTQLTNIISDSDKLIKLKMSNMFLRDEQLIKNLCYVI